jgi:hypothetical protein
MKKGLGTTEKGKKSGSPQSFQREAVALMLVPLDFNF